MKIVSLNTWGGVLWEQMAEFFETYKDEVDVFCLQEVYCAAEGKETPHPTLAMQLDLFEKIENILHRTHGGYFHAAHKDYYGQALFVRKNMEVLEVGDIVISEGENPGVRGRHNRNMQWIRLSSRGTLLCIANVHGLWNGMGKTDTPARIEQSRRIRDFITRQRDEVILMGDFNLNPDTESLARIEESGLRNLIREYGIQSTRTSYYEKEGRYADYAFVSPGVQVHDFRVLPDEVSDHSALFLDVA